MAKKFDKYWHYEQSVQNTEFDVEFIQEKYKKLFKKKPRLLREDFCGTGKLLCEWAKDSKQNFAFGLDLDPEPVDYGKENHLSKLKPEQQERVKYHIQDVMNSGSMKADVITAFNFSYFTFKDRDVLLQYFKEVRKALGKQGVFFLDILGGPECQKEMEEKRKVNKFTYFWECESFNPITNDILFHIHFKPKGAKRKIKKVFTYDWRLWSLPEIRDILMDAGFDRTIAYWEREDDKGEETGEFYETEEGEAHEAWVTYFAGVVGG